MHNLVAPLLGILIGLQAGNSLFKREWFSLALSALIFVFALLMFGVH